MIEVQPDGSGVTFRVKVQPHAGRDAVVGEHAGMLRVAVSAAPEKGDANRALVEVLASALRVSKRSVTILSGETAREKRVRVEGVTADAIQTAARGA